MDDNGKDKVSVFPGIKPKQQSVYAKYAYLLERKANSEEYGSWTAKKKRKRKEKK